MTILSVLALVVGFAACGDTASDTTLVRSSDPELAARVAELLPALVRHTGLELKEPVRVERRSRDDLVRYLRAKLDEELPPAEAARVSDAYRLLGLFPDDVDLREILLSVYTEQVAGFYDPDSTTLFLLSDVPVETVQTILVHELVHAVQDQTADLDSLTSRSRGNDRQTAAGAAIEGHATLVMLEYLAEEIRGEPVDLSLLKDFSRTLRPALEGMRSQYPALARAPAILQESLLFPYLGGATFVQELWQSVDGRPAPFGAYLPQSTEQVLEPERLTGASPDPPTELRLEVAGPFRPVYENTLGQLEVQVLLQEHLGPGDRSLAEGWDGDRFVLLEGAGGEALVWAAVWDDSGARDRFLEGFGSAVGRLMAPASLESVEVDGRPGTLLRIGVGDDVPVRIRVVNGG